MKMLHLFSKLNYTTNKTVDNKKRKVHEIYTHFLFVFYPLNVLKQYSTSPPTLKSWKTWKQLDI